MMNTRFSVFIAVSVDGFIARPNGDIDWLMRADKDDKEDYGYAEFIDSVDCVVMGRNTFEMVLRLNQDWPFHGTRVVVLSASLEAAPQPFKDRVEIHNGSISDLARRLRDDGHSRVYVDGGTTIRSFIRAGLIDDLTLTRIPLLLGEGRPLFGPVDRDVPLVHEVTHSYPNGFVQSVYRIERRP